MTIVFSSYYWLYHNRTSQKYNLFVTFLLVTLKDHGHACFFNCYFFTILFMYFLNLACKRKPSLESWLYDELGYHSVKLLVGNTPGNLARKAVFTSLGYIAVKQLDHYTTTELVIHKAKAHIDILTKSGEKLDGPTLERIYDQANSEFTPSLLNKI